MFQLPRVAKARNVPEDQLRQLVSDHIEGRLPGPPRRAARQRARAQSRARPARDGGPISDRRRVWPMPIAVLFGEHPGNIDRVMAEERHDADKRPSPDALLEAARREESRVGKLRIFVGAAPGVGKTYEMLQNARARQEGRLRCRRRGRRNPRQEGNGSPARGPRDHPSPTHGVQGSAARGDGPRRHSRPPAADRPCRRACPHQRARQPPSQALPRCAGDPE